MGRLRELSWNQLSGAAPLTRPVRMLFNVLGEERDRWALWLPVCLGTGIAVYFALDSEPDIWIGPLGLAMAAIIGVAGRRQTSWVVLFVAVGTSALGFTLAQLRTVWVSEPVLENASARSRSPAVWSPNSAGPRAGESCSIA